MENIGRFEILVEKFEFDDKILREEKYERNKLFSSTASAKCLGLKEDEKNHWAILLMFSFPY
jgi:hypothetical protein